MSDSMYVTDIRIAARERGETTFYLATPCKRGHYAPRYVSNGGCTECINGRFRKPLDDSQKQFVMRYTFDALLPAPSVLPVDTNVLSLYLASCMLQWERSAGVHIGINNWPARLAWCKETGKPLSECPIK